MTYEEFILTDSISAFKEKLVKLNRKAIKLGTEPIVLTVTSETEIRKLDVGTDRELFREFSFTKIIVEGETPKLNDWSLVATIIHDKTLGVMVNVVPGKELDPKYRNSTGECLHCNVKRIRNETFILEKLISKLTPDEKLKYLI